MPTLYVEDVPKDLYEGLRRRAKENRRSITAEVIDLLEHHVPTAGEIARRGKAMKRSRELRRRKSPKAGPFPTVVQMLREDRGR
jgi:plasmid stability protein